MDPSLSLEHASTTGNISSLHQILIQNPLSLDQIQIGDLIKTPLHIAAFHGHLSFIEEILRLNPTLSLVLDLNRRAPLHVAAYEGRSDVVRVLVQAAPEMCGVLDRDGRNPFHLAVVMGRAKVLDRMLDGIEVRVGVRERTGSGEGIIELCVKYDRFECLKLLVEKIGDFEFVNAVDGDGNNVFHQAVKYKRIQMIIYLINQQIKVNINATNSMGLTPLDIILQENKLNDFEIRDILRKAGALKADEIHSSIPKNQSYFNNATSFSGANSNEQIRHHESQNSIFGTTDWLPKRRDSLMIVASLIAAMAFSAGLTPPGGVWGNHFLKGDTVGSVNYENIPHRAGEAIIAYNYPRLYKFYIRTNTIAYVSSLSIILLMISGLPLRKRRYMWALQVVMWVTITAIGFTYAFVLSALTPQKNMASLERTLVVAFLVWCIVMALVFIGNAFRLVWKWVKRENMVSH